MIKTFFSHAFIRYVLIGGFAFVVEFVSFYILFNTLGVKLIVANALSFCLGLVVAFLLNRAWAFSAHEYSKKAAHQFGFYATLAFINLGLTLAIVAILKSFGMDPNIAKLVAMIITSSWNFIILKLFVFTHARQKIS